MTEAVVMAIPEEAKPALRQTISQFLAEPTVFAEQL
jgi:hypothetical protein